MFLRDLIVKLEELETGLEGLTVGVLSLGDMEMDCGLVTGVRVAEASLYDIEIIVKD